MKPVMHSKGGVTKPLIFSHGKPAMAAGVGCNCCAVTCDLSTLTGLNVTLPSLGAVHSTRINTWLYGGNAMDLYGNSLFNTFCPSTIVDDAVYGGGSYDCTVPGGGTVFNYFNGPPEGGSESCSGQVYKSRSIEQTISQFIDTSTTPPSTFICQQSVDSKSYLQQIQAGVACVGNNQAGEPMVGGYCYSNGWNCNTIGPSVIGGDPTSGNGQDVGPFPLYTTDGNIYPDVNGARGPVRYQDFMNGSSIQISAYKLYCYCGLSQSDVGTTGANWIVFFLKNVRGFTEQIYSVQQITTGEQCPCVASPPFSPVFTPPVFVGYVEISGIF
jgi:hypothetical protein